jgi:hypothetical protein
MTTHLRLCHAGSVSPPGGNTLLTLSEHISGPERVVSFHSAEPSKEGGKNHKL